MRYLSDVEFHEYLVNMLKFFTDFCNKNKVTFYMFYGSLIGTVRHQGFIPWDDDIDVMLPRADYEKLIRLFANVDGRYRIVSMHTDNSFTAPLAKLIDTKTTLKQKYGFKEKVELGVYIDLFVYDGFPDDIAERKAHMNKCISLIRKWSRANHSFHYENSTFVKDLARRLVYFPSIIKGTHYYLDKIDKNAKQYSYEESNFVGNATFVAYGFREIFEKKDLSTPILGSFEGITVPIPQNYDRVLTQLYNDWRKLPPKEEQVSHHEFECYVNE